MTTWWHYLILANLYLALFYAFYVLLLRRETFFQLNRLYLMGSAVLSFLLPLVQLDWVKHWFITEQVKQTIYRVNPAQVFEFTATPDYSLKLGDLLSYSYLLGLCFMLVKLVLQLIQLRRLLRKPESGTAYSFFGIIQVDAGLPEHKLITAHEEAHSRQWHSADRLLTELLLVINWFNPVAYLYRRALKHLHEFIADQQVVSQGASRKQYAQLLVSQAFDGTGHNLSSAFFNKSLLKQRIMMLQKNKSSRVALVKYGLSAPLFAAMVVLSSATLSKTTLVVKLNTKAEQAMDMSANQVAAVISKDKAAETGTQSAPEPDKAVGSANEIQSPEFPGGMKAFYTFLAHTLHYPDAARKANVSGRVILGFIVEKDGSLSQVRSLHGPGYGLDEEAVRAMSLSPKWIPGKKDGVPATVAFSVPVQFSMVGSGENTTVNATSNTADTTRKGTNEVFTSVEVIPQPTDGMDGFYHYLGQTIHYPEDARKAGVQGRVIVQFIVEKDGSLSDVKALRGPGYGLDDEAVRAIAGSPKWKPGMQNNKPVRVQFTVPVQFTLPDVKPTNNTKSTDSGSAGAANQKTDTAAFSARTDISKALWIIDGKTVSYTEFKNTNPNDIQSISVLKDKSATALYGEKGANGVIIITLKRKN